MRTLKLLFVILSILYAANNAKAQQWGLYTLYAPTSGTYTSLIDTNGTTYKTWTHSTSKKTGFSVYLTPGDTLVRAIYYPNNSISGMVPLTGEIQKVTWGGTVVWDYVYSTSTYCLHHDICPMPNGNVLMIAYVKKTAAEATQAGCSSSMTILSERIMEVKPTGATSGTIVWEWNLWDHLCQDVDATKDNYVTSIVNNPQLMNINYDTQLDWWHMNGIDYSPELDQITMSSRMMNEIYVIDHSTTTAEAAGHTGGNSGHGGDILYRWGNPAAYGATGAAIFDVVHDAHWISADNPKYPYYLCGFSNFGGAGGKSCFDIISPPYNGFSYSYTAGQAMPPATYAYRYTTNSTTFNNGTSQQLPNGNSLVCISAQSTLIEIDSTGTTLWTKTGTGQPANATRYDLCYVRGPVAIASASSMVVNPGVPITLNASATSVTESNPTYTYSWSSNPAGFTSNLQSPTVAPQSTTTFTVTITNTAIGCSATASVTPNIVSGIENYSPKETFTIYPNPSTGIFTISDGVPETEFIVTVTDRLGKLVFTQNNSKSIDLSSLENGAYFLTVNSDKRTYSSQKIVLIK